MILLSIFKRPYCLYNISHVVLWGPALCAALAHCCVMIIMYNSTGSTRRVEELTFASTFGT